MIDLGQVFTKEKVADYMVSLFDLPKDSLIMEPCCGEGAFLQALNLQKYKNVTGCELDDPLFCSLKEKFPAYTVFHMDFFKYKGSNSYDGIIMNPPYIRQEKIDALQPFGISKESLRSNPIFKGIPSSGNMYMYFILKAIDLLKENGQLLVIFPSSWMNAKIGVTFKNLLLAQCGLEKQVHIYGDVFEQAALVDVVILKLRKGTETICEEILFMEYKNDTLTAISSNQKITPHTLPCPFPEIATIKRGLTTGCNEMYINPHISCTSENMFKDIISSPKSITGYSTANARVDKLFSPQDVQEMEEESVLDYIKFWKNKIVQEQKPKTLLNKISKGDDWFQLREISSEGILFSYFVRNDMKFVMNETGTYARDNFYIITPKINKWILFAFLNSYYTFYQLELRGKKYGAGLLKLQSYDLEHITFPDHSQITPSDKEHLEQLAQNLFHTGESDYVEKITEALSKYCEVGFSEIKESYFFTKNNRLETY